MKKGLRVTFNAPVILGFVLSCFLVTLIGELTAGISTQMLFMTYHSSLTNIWTYIRLLTHVFGHDGWAHLAGNASYLLLLGPMLEEKYGPGVISEIIAVTALITGLVHYCFFWNTALCGASGVVFAFIILSSFTRFKEGEIPLTFILVMVIYLGEQVVEAIAVRDQVSNLSHIIGGLVGAFVGYQWNIRKAGKY